MLPLVSVVVPVFNHAHTLARALASIFAQTHKALEVVVVNDGSTDGLGAVISELQASFNFVYLEQAQSGAGSARNLGFSRAHGEFVLFWDADTVARTDFIARLRLALQNNPLASFAYSQFKFGWKTMRSQPFVAADLFRYNYIDTSSLVRVSVLRDIPGPFDPELRRFQDWDLWLTLVERKKPGVFVPEVLFKKIIGFRRGISQWLPAAVFRLPWRPGAVQSYDAARRKLSKKHNLTVWPLR